MSSVPLDDGFLRPEELAEIRQTFFDQARDALETLARDVLALEGQTPGPERLKSLRRAAHTLKGDCASVGFGVLSSLAHALEDAFTAVERAMTAVSPVEVDAMLEAVDALRKGVEAGAKGRLEPNVDAVVRGLLSIGGGARPLPWLDRLTDAQRYRIIETVGTGARAYRVKLTFTRSCRDRDAAVQRAVDALGPDVVAAVPPVGALAEAAECDVYMATRELLPDLLARVARVRGTRATIEENAMAPQLPVSDAPAGESGHDGETVRIEASRVDEVLTLVGELVTVRSTLTGLSSDIERHLPDDLGRRLADTQSLLGRVLQDLQRSTMRMRMVPAERVFRRFARAVRDLGRQTGKRIALRVEGESTELDRGILDALEEPLLHLVRNAVTHGIEDDAERATLGKPPEARLTIRAGREGNQILIEVADDGRGIDVGAVKRRAVESGFLRAEDSDALADLEAFQLVFRPGLSTAKELTEHAGRGVGLDVVRDTVESLRGSVTAENGPDGGAVFLIRVPLTIAIIQALLFRVAGRQLAVPLSSVVEIARVADVPLQRVGACEMVRLRDEVLGVIRLSRLLGFPDGPGTGYVMILHCGAGRFGVLADDMCGEQELVIKRVHDRWIRTPLVAGASIVGGGVPTLILDVLSIYRAALTHGAIPHD